MIKVTLVETPPTDFNEGDFYIGFPNFLRQVQKAHAKASGRKLTTTNYLREIMQYIAQDYKLEQFNPYRFPYSAYEGLAYTSDEDISAIIVRMLNTHQPEVFESVVDSMIKSRPTTVKKIFFRGPEQYLKIFVSNGITQA